MKRFSLTLLVTLSLSGITFAADKAKKPAPFDAEAIFKTLDANNDKTLNNQEFLTFKGVDGKSAIKPGKEAEKAAKRLEELFKKLDTDKDEKLTLDEFKKVTDAANTPADPKKKKTPEAK